MIRNSIVIFLIGILSASFLPAQDRTFRQFDPDRKDFRMKVAKNDRILIEEDSAYVYSMGMVQKIRDLEQHYLECLAGRDSDLVQVKTLLTSLQDSYTSVEELLNKSGTINQESVKNYQILVETIIGNLQKNIGSIQTLQNEIAGARQELEALRRQVKKERNHLIWNKTGSIFVALVAGFLVGFVIGTS